MAKYVVTPNPPWVKILKDPIKRALYQELRKIQLKPVNRFLIQFDPWHPNTTSIRNFIYYLSAEKYRATNPNCRVKTEILSNREEPQITVSFENGQQVIFKTSLLSELEIVENLNKFIAEFAPKKEEASSVY